MSKVKIIDSKNLKALKLNIIEKIDHAEIEADMYREELQRQKTTTQKEHILTETQAMIKSWLDRRGSWHECLVSIERYTSEIEI